LKEAAGGDAIMQIEWCWGDEKDFEKREWSEEESKQNGFGCSLCGVGARV
jgi:hypothetical protein